MNQYEMDDYVLPRRRSPWVLVGMCSRAGHSRMFLWPYTLLREVCAAANGRQIPACMFAVCRRWRNCSYFAGRVTGFQEGQRPCLKCQQSETDFVSVSTDMDGLAGQSKLVTAYDASACGCSGEQWSAGRNSCLPASCWVCNGISA